MPLEWQRRYVRYDKIEKFNMDWNAESGQLNQEHVIVNQSINNVTSVVRTQLFVDNMEWGKMK